MDISVVICTYNRSHNLKGVLKSLSEQIMPKELQWEIIIVDNNSTDETKSVVEGFKAFSGLRINYFFEPKQGKSYALNTGIQKAQGDIIAFTDDDIMVPTNWVEAIYSSFKKYCCDGLCGRIHIKLPQRIPPWLTKELWGFLGYLNYGDEPFFITEEAIFGGNVVYTRAVIERTGMFDVNRGRSADKLLGGEDVEYGERVVRQGNRVLYQPDLQVYHVIPSSKIRRRYFLKLHYYEGLIKGKHYDIPIGKSICGIPLFIVPQLLRTVSAYLKKPTLRMQMNIWWFWGFMRGRFLEHPKNSIFNSK